MITPADCAPRQVIRHVETGRLAVVRCEHEPGVFEVMFSDGKRAHLAFFAPEKRPHPGNIWMLPENWAPAARAALHVHRRAFRQRMRCPQAG